MSSIMKGIVREEPKKSKLKKMSEEELSASLSRKKTSENRIIGHDATDPEISVKGGAGSYKLSVLKKKALGEIKDILADIETGNFKRSSYNVNQLKNTLDTIAEAEEEMEKIYFNENTSRPRHWDYLGFDVRSDILWTELIFEDKQLGLEFNKWFAKYRDNMPELNSGQTCILALVAYTGKEVMIIYGPAEYISQDKEQYLLKNSTGKHFYSKRDQIVFEDLKQLNKFMVNLKLKFDLEIETKIDSVTESKGPCWKNYKQVGMKKKDGKTVPNCVPKESVNEIADTQTGANKTGDIIEPKHDKAYATLKVRAPNLYNYIRNEAPVPLDPVMTLQALQSMGNEQAVLRMIKNHIDQDTEKMYDRNHPALAENLKRMFSKILYETEKKKGTNGKACWDGYRYAGTENGKDKCVPVKKRKKTKESSVIKGLKR